MHNHSSQSDSFTYVDDTRTVSVYGSGDITVPVVVLDESSYVDLTTLVSTDGQLEWTPPVNGINSTWRIFSYWQQYTNQRECHGGLNATTVIGNGSWVVDHFSIIGAQKVTNFWDEQILVDQETADLLASVGEYCKLDLPALANSVIIGLILYSVQPGKTA